MKLELLFQYNLSDTRNCWQQVIQWFLQDSKVMLVERFVRNDEVIKWKNFPRYWPLWGEFTGPGWIPLIKASDMELWCFLWSVPEQTIE